MMNRRGKQKDRGWKTERRSMLIKHRRDKRSQEGSSSEARKIENNSSDDDDADDEGDEGDKVKDREMMRVRQRR